MSSIPSIKRLDQAVVNRIAAGEVINAIDRQTQYRN